MCRHLAFVFCAGLVLLVWMPALNICRGAVCRVFLIAVLVILIGMFFASFHGVYRGLQRRRQKMKEAGSLLDHWRRNGEASFSQRQSAIHPRGRAFFVDD
jgi:hypothetical protein